MIPKEPAERYQYQRRYNMELNRIYLTDAYEGMQKLDDNSIDLVLTDPPYGIGENNEQNLNRGEYVIDHGSYEWDMERIDKRYFEEIFRVSNNQIIFGANYYLDYLPPTKCMIVWDKRTISDFADCELAWTSFGKAVQKFTFRWDGYRQENMTELERDKRVYPTQKPTGLFKAILNDFVPEDNLILDPFIGSGTTAVAARALGLDFIGFDKSEQAVKIARKRLSNVQKELIR